MKYSTAMAMSAEDDTDAGTTRTTTTTATSLHQNGPALVFEVLAECTTTKARVSRIHLPHQVRL